MPDQRNEACRQTVGGLLSTTSPRIEVPDWQRSYSWTTEQVEAFWQDLTDFDACYPDENNKGKRPGSSGTFRRYPSVAKSTSLNSSNARLPCIAWRSVDLARTT